jgi:uracil-DNA glycosylase family 4
MANCTSKRPRCLQCPFTGPKVGTSGPEDSPFMIVGESPGREEVKQGLPFVGVSGLVVADAIRRSGIDLQGVVPYITNAMHCWPGNREKNEATLNMATVQCREALIAEINAHPRKLLITLGNAALRAVTNNYGLKITQERGKYVRPILANDITEVEHAVASIHPAYILRGGGNYRQLLGDFRYGLGLFMGGVPRNGVDVDYLVLDNVALLRRLADAIRDRTSKGELAIAADLETGSPPSHPLGPGGYNHIDDSILMLGLAWREAKVYIIPEDWITHPIVRRIFQESRVRWIWHNGKFDIKFLWSYGIPEARVDEDTMLMSYAMDERRGYHDLEEVAHDWLGSPRWKNILNKHKRPGQSYRVIPTEVLYHYAALDISNTLRLYQTLRPVLNSDPDDRRLYERTHIPASATLAKIEDRGIAVDFKKVKENKARISKAKEPHIEVICSAALSFPGHGYSDKLLNSPLQLCKLLYDDLRIPTKVRSTSDAVLEELPNHPVVVALRNYRKLNKQETTYVDPLRDAVASDKRIHTTYKIHGTATGRLSSGDPINMQNIPRDADIRAQFIPGPGRLFVEPDYNQAELRSLAALSGDKRLCRIYRGESNEGGIHDTVRTEMFGNPGDWSTAQIERFKQRWYINAEGPKLIKAILDEQKMKAKNINFGIVYGITSHGLAEQLDCSRSEAQSYLNTWAETFPEAHKFIRECMMAPQRGQNLVTPFGNRKRHQIVTQENVHALQKEAANFLHQAIASMLMLHGVIEVQEPLIQQYDAHVVNLVHDSMLIEVPDDFEIVCAVVEYVKKVLQRVPIDWGITRIPFVADAKVGPRWGRAYQVDFEEYKRRETDALISAA